MSRKKTQAEKDLDKFRGWAERELNRLQVEVNRYRKLLARARFTKSEGESIVFHLNLTLPAPEGSFELPIPLEDLEKRLYAAFDAAVDALPLSPKPEA